MSYLSIAHWLGRGQVLPLRIFDVDSTLPSLGVYYTLLTFPLTESDLGMKHSMVEYGTT